jgi:hypothetical protein
MFLCIPIHPQVFLALHRCGGDIAAAENQLRRAAAAAAAAAADRAAAAAAAAAAPPPLLVTRRPRSSAPPPVPVPPPPSAAEKSKEGGGKAAEAPEAGAAAKKTGRGRPALVATPTPPPTAAATSAPSTGPQVPARSWVTRARIAGGRPARAAGQPCRRPAPSPRECRGEVGRAELRAIVPPSPPACSPARLHRCAPWGKPNIFLFSDFWFSGFFFRV